MASQTGNNPATFRGQGFTIGLLITAVSIYNPKLPQCVLTDTFASYPVLSFLSQRGLTLDCTKFFTTTHLATHVDHYCQIPHMGEEIETLAGFPSSIFLHNCKHKEINTFQTIRNLMEFDRLF